MNKKAFTLAEILITLGIIGVVAAMTIPNLMLSLRNKRLQSNFMKTYSELNQASRTFYANEDMQFREYQETMFAGSSESNESFKLFMALFKGVTNSNKSPRSYDQYWSINNLNLGGKIVEQWPCDKSSIYTDIVGRDYAVDDMVGVYGSLDIGPKICVDINGRSKPNTWGKDRFVFVFDNDSAVIPYTGIGWNVLDANQIEEAEIAKYCSYSQANVTHTCAYFALKDKSPTGNGSYWKDFLK